ncbi:MAG: hypothetical protein M1821_010001 [Bathelium mastoideum]|nr:MAG: hypothetical protein M1821_010001 [Bathelium mastoideum]
MGRISNVEFGNTDDEVLMWTEFGAGLTVWDLRTGKSVEIKDPKYSCASDTNTGDEGPGWAYKPSPPHLSDEQEETREERVDNKILALLSRVGSRDILSFHAPQTLQVLSSTDLPSVDARGLKWSPDGRWLAIWEAHAYGTKVWIYTADGHLYRTYTGDEPKETEDAELGTRCIEWSPTGEWLALGGSDRRVTLLNTRTFAPLVHLDHSPHIHLPSTSSVYVESLPSSTKPNRSYGSAPQPFTLPTSAAFVPPTRNKPSDSSAEACPPSGISNLTFNSTGTLLASLSPAHPSTTWIWDLHSLASRAVIIQSQPIKRVTWAPNRSGLLLIQCRMSEPIAYLWDAEGLPSASADAVVDESTNITKMAEEDATGRINAPPEILHLPLEKRAPGSASRLEATWLPRRIDQTPAFVFGDPASFIVVRPRGGDRDADHEDDRDARVEQERGSRNGRSGEATRRKSQPRGASSEGSRPHTPHGSENSEDSLYEILTGRSPVRVQRIEADDSSEVEGVEGSTTVAIAEMVDAQEGEDDFTRMEDTFAGKGALSFGNDSEIF